MSVVRLPDCGASWLDESNRLLAAMSVEERAAWLVDALPGPHVLTSSFGAQAAVMLHLMTRVRPDIPVVLIDTGYLFRETYRFVDDLTDRLQLNLKVYQASQSAAWQEARYGKLWEQGLAGIDRYNQINKVEPLERAMQDLGARTWFAGLRASQSHTRAELPYLECRQGRYKALPIVDLGDREIYLYLKRHDLPYHPLWEQGYVSIGDVHTTRSLHEVDSVDQTRFFGLKRECGIHEAL